MKTILITERNKSEAYLKQEKTEIIPFLPCGSWLNHREKASMGPLMKWGRSIFCLSTGNGAPFCRVSLFLFLLPLSDVQVDSRGDSLFSGAAAAAAKSRQSCPTLCDPIDSSPPRLPHLWDSPGKNTGVGCHFLLQCMKVKSESEVAQLCPTLRDPMDYSPLGSSVCGIFQARGLEWGAIVLW